MLPWGTPDKTGSIQGNILEWIRLFLSERKQAVVVNGVKSVTNNVLSGIPPGSVMDPLLFLIYINGFPSMINIYSIVVCR